MTFKTLEELQKHYQSLHDVKQIGGNAIMHNDGEGHVGFLNPNTYNWDWWGVNKQGQYEMTGSTQDL